MTALGSLRQMTEAATAFQLPPPSRCLPAIAAKINQLTYLNTGITSLAYASIVDSIASCIAYTAN